MKYVKSKNTTELDDKEILETLRKLPEMYENGELLEVEFACFDIYEAIREFELEYS